MPLKNTLPVLARQKVPARSTCVCAEHSCTWATKEVSVVYMPECCHTEHIWLEKGGKASKIQQGSNPWKTSITHWHFPKTFWTVISSLKVRSIPCSPWIQLALHTSTDSLCNWRSGFPWGNSCPTVKYYCPHHFISNTNVIRWLWNRAQKCCASSSEQNHSGQLRKPCTVQ